MLGRCRPVRFSVLFRHRAGTWGRKRNLENVPFGEVPRCVPVERGRSHVLLALTVACSRGPPAVAPERGGWNAVEARQPCESVVEVMPKRHIQAESSGLVPRRYRFLAARQRYEVPVGRVPGGSVLASMPKHRCLNVASGSAFRSGYRAGAGAHGWKLDFEAVPSGRATSRMPKRPSRGLPFERVPGGGAFGDCRPRMPKHPDRVPSGGVPWSWARGLGLRLGAWTLRRSRCRGAVPLGSVDASVWILQRKRCFEAYLLGLP